MTVISCDLWLVTDKAASVTELMRGSPSPGGDSNTLTSIEITY